MDEIQKLSDFLISQGSDVHGFDCRTFPVAQARLVFEKLVELGIKKIKVNKDEMSVILHYFLGNDCGNTKMLREGKVDKFMGVRLICYN